MHLRRALRALVALPLTAAAVLAAAPSTQANAAPVSSANNRIAYNFFVSKGLTPAQAAGVTGNLMMESGSPINPQAREWGGGPGRGIAQWSVGGRWNSDYHDNLVWYAGYHHASPWSLNTQLNFVWYELNHDSSYGLRQLRATRTSTAATMVFMRTFEMCGACAGDTRASYAHQVLASYHG